MSARDELFDGLFDLADKYEIKLTNSPDMHPGVPEIGDFCGDVEAVVLAAGYTKPRTITTAEELDALGHGSVIRSEHRHYWVAHKEDGMGSDQGWATAGGGAITSRELTSWLPATVLYEPAP